MQDYFPLFIIIAVAWIVPMVLSGLEISKIPSVIVEIIMGVLIGPFVLNLVSGEGALLNFLSYMGFLLLIFLSGIALDVQKIIASFPAGRIHVADLATNTFIIAILIYVGSIAVSAFVVYSFPVFAYIDKVFMIIVLPSVALSIIVPIIKNDGELTQKFGQIILLEGAIATIMTILLISIYSGIHSNKGFQFELLLLLIIFAVFFIAYKVGTVLIKVALFRRLLYKLEHSASQIRIRGAIAVLLLFVFIASVIKTEPVLGAFFAGTLLSLFLSKERSALIFKLDGMSYGFFIPIFFIMVGVNLDMNSLKNFVTSFNFIISLTAAFYIVQLIPAAIMVKLFGWKKSISSSLLLSSRMGLTIASAQIGMSIGLISPATNAGIVVAAILTSILSPMLYKYLSEKKDHQYSVYIFGGKQASIDLASRFDLHGIPYLIIEANKDRWEYLQSMGLSVMLQKDDKLETYQGLDIRPEDTVVVLTGSDKKNMAIARIIKNELGHSKIITTARNPDLFLDDVHLNDVQVVNIDEVIAGSIEKEIMQPTASHALTDSFDVYSVEEIPIRNNDLNRMLVKDIAFPTSGSLVLLRRDNEVFIPHGDTHLLTGDLVTVIGNAQALEEFRKIFD